MTAPIRGRPVVPGRATGRVLATDQPLSFWGGYDQHTGEIIDRRHPLSGEIAAGRILVLPGSRGSSTTSAVLLEAVRLGTVPAAIVTTAVDRFVTLAGIVADEMWGKTVPIVVISPEQAALLVNGSLVSIDAEGVITGLE